MAVRRRARGKGRSVAVSKALERRTSKSKNAQVRIQYFADKVSNSIGLHMRARSQIATELVKSKVVVNISRPVTKTRFSAGKGQKTIVRVTDRSKSGEFPKADTTTLMKDVFSVVKSRGKTHTGFIGTRLLYGLVLELRRRRSFLRRTLEELRPTIFKILSGPIKNPEKRPVKDFISGRIG